MSTPVYTSHDLVQTAVLAALNALNPANNAHWDVAPAGTVARLALVDDLNPDAAPLTRVYVAQHQDGPGERSPRLRSAGWAGLVVVRCLSRTQSVAQAGYALAVTAMAALTSPTGYAIRARFDRQIPIPVTDRIYTSAGQWELFVRRVP